MKTLETRHNTRHQDLEGSPSLLININLIKYFFFWLQIWEIDSIRKFSIDVSGDVKHGLPLVDEGTVCAVPIKAPGLQIYNVFYHFCFKGTYFLLKFQCWTQQTYFRNTWLYLLELKLLKKRFPVDFSIISVTKIWRHANFSLVYQTK